MCRNMPMDIRYRQVSACRWRSHRGRGGLDSSIEGLGGSWEVEDELPDSSCRSFSDDDELVGTEAKLVFTMFRPNERGCLKSI